MRVALATYAGTTPFFDLLIPDRGLATLAAVLDQHNADYQIYDLNRLDLSCGDFLSDLRRFKPDIIGFKFFDTGFPAVELLANQVKREHPQALVIAGGPHVTLFQEHLLQVCSAFDILLYGEGELSLPALLHAHASGSPWINIPGAIFRDTAGVIQKTPQVLVTDLDSIPFPKWNVFDLERYLPIAMLNVTRGCPYKCSFCAHNWSWGYKQKDNGYEPIVRNRSVSSVLREIQEAQDIGLSLFGFTDSIPIAPIWRALAEGMLKLSRRPTWTSFAYVGHFTDEDLDLMARSGCAALWYGIESGSDELRYLMGKSFSNDDVLHNFEVCKRVGIVAIPGFIVGFPGETATTLRETMALCQQLDSPVIVLSPFILDPGTPVASHPERFGVEIAPNWQKTILRRIGLNEFELPYFKVNGVSNVDLWNDFRTQASYPGYQRDRNVAESEFAYLIARATGETAAGIVEELDGALKTFNTQKLSQALTRIRAKVQC